MTGFIVLGLAFVFFLVVAYFSARTWQVGHVVVMSFLFLFTLVLLFLTATLFRTYQEYHPRYEEAVAALEQERARHRSLTYGSPGVPAGEGSLKGEQKLARVEQFGRGRVWRNVYGQVAPGNPEIALRMGRWNNDGCLAVGGEDLDEAIDPIPDATNGDEDAVPADGDPTAAADPAAVDPAAAAGVVEGAPPPTTKPHGIDVGQFLYAFKEFPVRLMTPAEKAYYFGDLSDGEDNYADTDKRDRCRIPIVYLGKFRVTQQNDQVVTVLPVSKLDPFQMQQIGNPASWVLYESLPADSHDVFDGVEREQLTNLIPLKRLNNFGIRLSPPAYQEIVDQYAQDGEALTRQVNDPLRTRVQVRFKQPYEVAVDLDVEGELPETNQPFNVEGRAQTRNLIQGEPTKFAEGDVATFDGLTANRLVQQGLAERVGNPTYARRLRDFEFELDDNEVRSAELNDDLALVTKEVAALKGSLDRLQGQTDKLKAEMVKLQQDLSGFDAERTALFEYLQLLRSRVQYLRNEINRLIALRQQGTDGQIDSNLVAPRPDR